MAVDKINPKFSHASVIALDLTKSEHQTLVLDWIKHERTVAVFMAPPCGTCSLAREIPIEGDPYAPRPVRSTLEPDGLMNLSEVERLRVSQANILYYFCQQVFDLCTHLNKPCMVENPLNSLFWLTTPWRELETSSELVYQSHQACAYGGKRPKWTLLAANFSQVQMVNLVCDNSHPHEAWGKVAVNDRKVFATSLEVHYPQKLCDAISNCFLVRLQQQYNFSISEYPTNSDFKAATLVQPRGTKAPVLFSPFSSKILAIVDADNIICWPSNTTLPDNPKILHESLIGGIMHEGDKGDRLNNKSIAMVRSKLQQIAEDAGIDIDVSNTQIPVKAHRIKVFGIQLEPEAFVQKAIQAEHPMSVESCLPEVLHQTIEFLASTSDLEVMKVRMQFVKKWLTRAEQLQPMERELRTGMDPHVSRVTQQKRILLFEEILKDLSYPDVRVVDELKLGVNLVGEVPVTNMLPQKRTQPLLTQSALNSRSSMIRSTVRASVGPSGDEEMDTSIWEQTIEEVSKGWLQGPLSDADVPFDAPISRRFGVRQKSKIRPIDDFSASGVNRAAGVSEAPALHTIDVIGSMLVDWLKCNRERGNSSETLLRTFDLKSAYRQIGLNEQGRAVAFIVVYNPCSKRGELFQCRALPFGAVRSVHSFLRLARAVWFVGTVGCKLAWSSFFDDFLVASRPSLTRSTELTIVTLFKMLGWDFAETGKKCVPFDETTEVLGVHIDASLSSAGKICVKNTQSRISELTSDLELIVSSKLIHRTTAQRLRGRMQFADSQLFGRCGKKCIKALGGVADGRTKHLTGSQKLQLQLFQSMLANSPPRQLVHDAGNKTLLFTDACYEPDSPSWICGLGAVAISPTLERQYFSLCLNEGQREKLGALRKKQIIFEAETIAAILAFAVWSKSFCFHRCILFVDNEGTKHSMISGVSENPFVQAAVEIFSSMEVEINAFLWIARVASYSNIADEPSRGETTKLNESGAKSVSEIAVPILDKLITKAFDLELGGNGSGESLKSPS